MRYLKQINTYHFSTRLKKGSLMLFRYALLIGLGFIIIYPYLTKISTMFMSEKDLQDSMVWLIPKYPTWANVEYVIEKGKYWSALLNSTLLALGCAVLQTLSCTMVGYGLARFQFKGRGIIFALMVFTIIIPPATLSSSLYLKFRFFDIFGLLEAIGIQGFSMIDTPLPFILLSAAALGLKNGLFMLVMWQRFRGVPKELSEAAFVDGANQFKTFWQVIMPQAKAMMISVLVLSIAWQWTDNFYSNLFLKKLTVLPNVIATVTNISAYTSNSSTMYANAAIVMIILPLFLFYLCAQKFVIQGVEQSGLVG